MNIRTLRHRSITRWALHCLVLGVFLAALQWSVFAAPAPLDSAPVEPGGREEIAPVKPDPAKASGAIIVKGFRFKGNTSVASASLDALLAGYLVKSCNIYDLNDAAGKVTNEYHKRGLNFAKAYILPQEIKDGIVEITVIEGKLGEIHVEGNRNYSTDFIRNFLTKAAAGIALTTERLERGLLILNSEFTDLKVRAGLEPGKEPGTVDVRLKAEDSYPVHVTVYGNNYGQENVSRYRIGTQIEWTNALIRGALLNVGGFVGDKTDRISYGNGAFIVPLNSNGTKLAVNFATGSFTVGKEFQNMGIYGKESTGGVFITHPCVKSRTFNLSGTLGFRSTDAKFYLLDQLSSFDKIRVAYLDISGDHVGGGGKSFASLNYTQGLGSFMNGTQAGDPFASRLDADNSFGRLALNLARVQYMGTSFSVLLRLAGTWASKPLLAGEQWQIGGVDSVRGYAPGEATGDDGYKGSLELRFAPLKNKEAMQLAAFVDCGTARSMRPMVGAPDRKDLTGAGFAIYSHLGSDAFSYTDLRLDVGWPVNPSRNLFNENPVLYLTVSRRF